MRSPHALAVSRRPAGTCPAETTVRLLLRPGHLVTGSLNVYLTCLSSSMTLNPQFPLAVAFVPLTFTVLRAGMGGIGNTARCGHVGAPGARHDHALAAGHCAEQRRGLPALARIEQTYQGHAVRLSETEPDLVEAVAVPTAPTAADTAADGQNRALLELERPRLAVRPWRGSGSGVRGGHRARGRDRDAPHSPSALRWTRKASKSGHCAATVIARFSLFSSSRARTASAKSSGMAPKRPSRMSTTASCLASALASALPAALASSVSSLSSGDSIMACLPPKIMSSRSSSNLSLASAEPTTCCFGHNLPC